MQQLRALVIEDDIEINKILCDGLKNNGIEADSAFNGIEGTQKALNDENDYHVILLDLMLPYRDGSEVLRSIREKSNVPVIVLSAKDQVITKVELLRLGADDYVTKPFSISEVVARINTIWRREKLAVPTEKHLSFDDIELNPDEQTAYVGGKELRLTTKEYLILEMLVKNPYQVISKTRLINYVWGESIMSSDNTLNTHIGNLRNKLKSLKPDKEYIETIWAVGYRMKKMENLNS